MALLQNLDTLDAQGKKGDWCFLNDDRLMALRYGDEIENTCVIAVRPGANKHVWNWDGNKDAPTLSPSIRCYTGDKTLWHGFLEHGVLREA